MKELKESQIKLFGREIVLPENGGEDSSGKFNGDDSDLCEVASDGGKEEAEGEKHLPDDKGHIAEQTGKKPEKEDQNPDESRDLDYPSGPDENSTTPPIDEVAFSKNKTEPESEQTDPAKNGTLKALKKPDKILPCPRCNSMDTKFCYYNNYNVNQPRHFCKSCQRYWTAGGTMRNVPVGAGRRKNKSSTSHCRHITIPEALQVARVDPPGFNPNSTVLSFGPGPDSPLCESMASGLNLAEKRAQNRVPNGLHKTADDGRNPGPDGLENGPRQPIIHNMNGLPIPVPCIPGIPWNFPVPLPAICPVPFYPAPYWNYNLTSAWSCPWVTTQSPTANRNATGGSGPGSPLGKHSRNGELLKACGGSENKDQPESKDSERSIVVPKTLRIDDPKEAAKSSIWETLGIKYDSNSREGLFKALQPKCSEGKIQVSASPVLQANPAALSRSISFQEGA